MQVSQRLNLIHSHPLFPAAHLVMERLRGAGFEVYLAGGCVRDALMGRAPKDFDIATSAVPAEVERLFPKTINVGREFGVMIVVTDSASFEVASFRFDGAYIDGRRPSSVTFTNAEEDAKRRDFTVNALFYDPEKTQVIDYVGGLRDLERGILRTVGVPQDRFREDKLRMLRAVRFAAQTGFELEEATFEAIQKSAPEITVVSRERIFQELSRILVAPHWVRGLELLKFSGLARDLWPEVHNSAAKLDWRGLGQPLNWEHSFCAVMWSLRAEASAEARLNAWSAPKNSVRKVQAILAGVARLANSEVSRVERFKILGGEYFAEILSVLRLHFLQAGQNTKVIESWINEFLEVAGPSAVLPAPLLKGEDLLEIGFQQDKKLGSVLKQLYEEQLEGRLHSKPAALARARALRQA